MKRKIPRIFPKQLRAVHLMILKPVQSFPTSSTPCKIKVNKKDVIVLQNTLVLASRENPRTRSVCHFGCNGMCDVAALNAHLTRPFHHALEPLREQHGVFLPPERALRQCKTPKHSGRSSVARLWASLPAVPDGSVGQARV